VIFSDINFSLDIKKVELKVNPEAFVRIVDNLLSNAGKYNVEGGTVKLTFIDKYLIIEDSGIGIKNPNKVFNRFYRETSRGMGIGLHVVKKLCDALNIGIKVESQLKKGTKFSLNLEKVMFG
jgi:signal transduction histidine kinase